MDYQKSIYKLEKIIVRDISLKGLMNYLYDKRQCVKENGICSDPMTVTRVFQGTVLGPLMFLIYIK